MTLPSSSALEALAVLARTGSVTRTAEALALSHSAVSHKLKALEQTLGFTLTTPDGRGVALTPRARQYVEHIGPALDVIRRASTRGACASGPLTVNAAPGFAANWLCWRLTEFTTLHPEVHLRVNTPRGYGDVGRREDDLYITFARESDVPDGAKRLLGVSFFPIAASSLLNERPLLQPADVLDHTLFHLDTREDWAAWLEAAGVAAGLPRPGIMFQDVQVMHAATQAGQGLSLGDTLTASAALERGQLIRPFTAEVAATREYFLVPGAGIRTAAAEAFEQWLVQALAIASEGRSV